MSNTGSFPRNNLKSEGAVALEDFASSMQLPPVQTRTPAPSQSQGQSPKAPPVVQDSPKQQEDKLENAIKDLEKSPQLTYAERVAQYGLTENQALELIDTLMTSGQVKKTYKITKKHTVTFVNRDVDALDRTMKQLEDLSPSFPVTATNHIAKYNIAASIHAIDSKDLSTMSFEQRLEFVSKLPDVIFRLLATQLSKFDQMLQEVVSDGSIENF